mgnify:CR=1 FL=1
MIEKLKRIHYMFYVSLVFMTFPFATIFFGQIPWWHFFFALFFMVSYLGILITEDKKLTWFFGSIFCFILQEVPFILEVTIYGFTTILAIF